MINFSIKFKNVILKNILNKICTNPSKQEFDILYKLLIETNDAIKAWLKVKLKKKGIIL